MVGNTSIVHRIHHSTPLACPTKRVLRKHPHIRLQERLSLRLIIEPLRLLILRIFRHFNSTPLQSQAKLHHPTSTLLNLMDGLEERLLRSHNRPLSQALLVLRSSIYVFIHPLGPKRIVHKFPVSDHLRLLRSHHGALAHYLRPGHGSHSAIKHKSRVRLVLRHIITLLIQVTYMIRSMTFKDEQDYPKPRLLIALRRQCRRSKPMRRYIYKSLWHPQRPRLLRLM